MDEPQPPLPPTSTHPLFKSPAALHSPSQQNALNYNSSEAPKGGFYPNQQHQQQQHQQQHQHQQIKNPSSNPWEREEREKKVEIKRQLWRDQQIVELSLLPSKTPQQEEQLKNLVLERDFERRAKEEENEEENEAQYQKNSGGVQEVLRLQPNSTNVPPSQITAPTTRLKQVDIKTTPTNISPSSEVTQNSNDNYQSAPPVQPKSILKSTHAYNSNPSSPSKHPKVTSFAPKTQNLTEITMNNTNANQMLTQLNKEMAELTVDYPTEETNGPMPPPPPERGSSFAVMHQQKVRSSGNFQKMQFNDHQMMNNNNNTNSKYVPLNNNNEHSPMMMSPTGTNYIMAPTGTVTAHQLQQQMNLINNNIAFTRDNKRVSFHDHENNNIEIVGEQDLSLIREDPNVSLTIYGEL